MDAIKNDNIPKVIIECKELEKKLLESAQESKKNAADDKNEESPKRDDAIDDNVASILAFLYTVSEQEKVFKEKQSQSYPERISNLKAQLFEDSEESSEEDDEVLKDRLLQELNSCLVFFTIEEEKEHED